MYRLNKKCREEFLRVLHFNDYRSQSVKYPGEHIGVKVLFVVLEKNYFVYNMIHKKVYPKMDSSLAINFTID